MSRSGDDEGWKLTIQSMAHQCDRIEDGTRELRNEIREVRGMLRKAYFAAWLGYTGLVAVVAAPHAAIIMGALPEAPPWAFMMAMAVLVAAGILTLAVGAIRDVLRQRRDARGRSERR